MRLPIRYPVIVDALLGTGAQGMRPELAQAIESINGLAHLR